MAASRGPAAPVTPPKRAPAASSAGSSAQTGPSSGRAEGAAVAKPFSAASAAERPRPSKKAPQCPSPALP
eukprot:11124190-Alexandrium_andersonii.AAC.1